MVKDPPSNVVTEQPSSTLLQFAPTTILVPPRVTQIQLESQQILLVWLLIQITTFHLNQDSLETFVTVITIVTEMPIAKMVFAKLTSMVPRHAKVKEMELALLANTAILEHAIILSQLVQHAQQATPPLNVDSWLLASKMHL